MTWYAFPICVVIGLVWLLRELHNAPTLPNDELLLTDEIGNRERRKVKRQRRDLSKAAYVEAEVSRLRAARERMS